MYKSLFLTHSDYAISVVWFLVYGEGRLKVDSVRFFAQKGYHLSL